MDKQITRITSMESALDASGAAIRKLSDALDEYEAIADRFNELEEYYGNGDWRTDFEADEAGLLPPDLKRGVLSEDAVYDLITEHEAIMHRISKIYFDNWLRRLKLREFRPEDSAVICSWVQDEASMYEWSADRIAKYPFDADDLNAHHAWTMKNERFMPYTFADADDVPVGHIAIRYPDEADDSYVRFGFVIIDPSLRRKGIGTAMLAAACDYSRDVLHAITASLSVFLRNEKAIKCYESAGFRPSREKGSYTLPIGDWECVIMEKAL